MCRMLLVNLAEADDVRQYIESFALKCRNSKEYQGDGFGISYIDKNKELRIKKSLKPIWDASSIIQKIPYTNFALVHARSAYGEDTIGDLENNQPFGDKDFLFAFNGNLKGVKLKAEGKIGAHKIFNFLKGKEIKEGIKEIVDKSRYIQSLNLIVIRDRDIYVHNQYGSKEDADYFNLWLSETDSKLVISSEKLDFLEMESLDGRGGFEFELFNEAN